MATVAAIPMQTIGPVKIVGALDMEVRVPLATYETPLWASTNRGARVTYRAGGIQTLIMNDKMARSIVLQAPDAMMAHTVIGQFANRHAEIQQLIQQNSRFAELVDFHTQQVGNLIYLRIEISTGDASGHNMVTLAAEQIMNWLLIQYSDLKYVSISANYCTDKKVSAVNGILGRGKYVISEVVISRFLCQRYLKTTPEKLVDLHIKKNLIGSVLAGGLRSANAHFANILLAFYLATGQDAANIIEGSQGIVHAEVRNEGDLYFSTTLPNIIVGTVGNGKHHSFVQDNLRQLGCLEQRDDPGQNARRLAMIIGATVLCGELSLLAALTQPGELMTSHLRLERTGAIKDAV